MFSEEQFEVYRALGFHMAYGFLSGQDVVCVKGLSAVGEPEVKRLKFDDDSNPDLAAVYSVLVPPPPKARSGEVGTDSQSDR